MYNVLVSALPEFLGSLSAGLVIAGLTWAVRQLRARQSASASLAAETDHGPGGGDTSTS
ncbi:hypothetical protein AB0O51_19140 [Streptomyces sp. NPDC090301]|uniref:hypothetical protein n=1 Tax=Streptomyces sp. NPDC090301 TaxID=3154975 RepID=UPI00343EB02A